MTILRKDSTRHFYRHLYGGQLVTVTILKRRDDQNQGTVRSCMVFDCRQGPVYKTGETIQGNTAVGLRTTWHLPAAELNRAGINYLNSLDRIIGPDGFFWQPEAPQTITTKLFQNWIDVNCVSINPPGLPIAE